MQTTGCSRRQVLLKGTHGHWATSGDIGLNTGAGC
jgi:hypothetical protein